MKKYHKIQTVYCRDKNKILINGQFSEPEFEYLKNNQWVFTEKVNGTNIRIMYTEGSLTFDGKTDDARIPPKLFTKLLTLFSKETLIEIFKDTKNVCLYGEGYGVNIAKHGKHYIKDNVDFILFDVKIGDIWLERHNVEDIADKLKINIVPIIGEGTLLEGIELVKNQQFKSQLCNIYPEGLVMRPKVELFNRKGGRIITKIKTKDFFENKLSSS